MRIQRLPITSNATKINKQNHKGRPKTQANNRKVAVKKKTYTIRQEIDGHRVQINFKRLR